MSASYGNYGGHRVSRRPYHVSGHDRLPAPTEEEARKIAEAITFLEEANQKYIGLEPGRTALSRLREAVAMKMFDRYTKGEDA